MEAYALSQGITESWQSMSQAEKVMVRYNYLMSVTSAQQNDFQRTQASFANQTRLLTLNIQQLAATIGQGLIAAVLPAVTALNKLFAVLQKAATAVRNFFYVLTGYEGGGSSGIVTDIASGMEDVESASGGAASGIGDAADAAENLKDQLTLLPFDQINKLSDTSIGDAGSSGGGAGSGIGDGGLGGIDDSLSDIGGKEPEKYVNAWAERIRKAFLAEDWELLGEEIAWGLNKGLQKVYDVISWDNVGPKITAFTTAFTRTFNSLVDNFDWDLLGRTIGAGINTAVNTANQLIGNGGIDFKQIGTKISVGMRGAIDEINWKNLGNAIGNGFMISWNFFDGFVTDMSRKSGAGITGWEELGNSIGKALKGTFEKIDFSTIGNVFVKGFNGIFDFLKGFNAEKPFEGLGTKISTALNKVIRELDPVAAGTAISDFVTGLLNEFVIIAEQTDWAEFGKKVGELLENIDWGTILSDIGIILSEVFGGLIDGLSETTVGKIVLFVAQMALAFKGKSVLESVSGLTGGISSKFSWLSGIFGSSSKQATDATATLGNATTTSGGFLDLFGGKLKGLAGKFANSAVVTGGFIALLESMNDSANAVSGDGMMALQTALSQLKDQGKITDDQFNDMYSTLTTAQAKGIEFDDSMSYVRDALDKAGVSTEDFESTLSDTLNILGVSSKDKAKIIGSGIADGTKEGIEEKADEVKKATEGIGSKIINWFKDLFGIHSPSTVFAEIGRNIIQGLINGFSELTKNALDSISQIGKDIIDGITNGIDTSNIKSKFSGIVDIIENQFTSVPNFFKNTFGKAVSAIEDVFKGTNGWFSKKWEQIKNVFSPVEDTFKNWFGNAYKNVQNAWNPANSWFSNKWSQIKTVFSPVANNFKTWFSNAYTNVKNAWSSSNTWFQGKWTSIKNVFGDVPSFFKSGFQKAYDSVKSIWSGIGSYFKKIANNIISPIEKAVNGIISGVNWVLKKVGSKTRLSSWSAPKFASGSKGLQRDTLGVVNDQKGATYKELIVPPNGQPFIPKGRNVMLPLQKGTKIMPAKQTKDLMESMGVPHFKNGIGDFISGAWNAVRNFTGDIFDYLTNPGDIVKVALDKFMNLSSLVEPWLSVAGGIANTVFGGIKEFIGRIFDDLSVGKIEKAIQWALNIAADNTHGYDQASRWGPNYDCSSFVISAFEKAGIKLKSAGATYTGNMYSAAKSVGFKDVTGSVSRSSQGGLKRGDILLNRAHHTAIYLGKGQIVQASSNEFGKVTGGKSGDQTGREIYSRSYYNYPWNDVLRFSGKYKDGIGTVTFSDLFGKIPKLARGGLIQAPTLTITGERYRKEAVLPLENRRTMRMVADSIVDSSEAFTGLSKEEIQQAVAQGVAMAMMNNNNNNQSITVYAELKTENDEVLARAVTRGQQKIDYRFNPVPQIG